jgi:ABC-type transport system involved in cytochrome bd biosynthesis fused ATPase/permease subunit
MLRCRSVTPSQVGYAIAVGLLTCFVFWLLIPSLERLRDKLRERAAKAPLSAATQAEMLKQMRMSQDSVKQLEQFRANPTDRFLYLLQLTAAAMLLSGLAAFLYFVHQGQLSAFVMFLALFLFFMVIVSSQYMTDDKIDKSLASRRKSIEEAKIKLKITD